MRTILICLLVLNTTACSLFATKEPDVRIVYNPIPIPFCPAPPLVEKPSLLTELITPTTPDGDVAKAYKHDIKALKGYAEQQQDVINTYSGISSQYDKILDQVRLMQSPLQ